MANSMVGMMNLGMVKRGTGKVVSLPAYSNDVLNALTATDGLPGLDAENAVYIIRNRGQRMGGTLDQQWPTDLDPTLLLKQGVKGAVPVVRGQAPADDSRYWHANPLDRSDEMGYPPQGDSSSGSLHEPMRLAQPDPSVVNAYYEAARNRAVEQAHWTGHAGGQDDPVRALPLPDNGYNVIGSSGIVPVAAWNEAASSNRYGNPFAPQQTQGATQPKPWIDPDAQARAIQLANNNAWSAPPATQGQQLTPTPLPIQNRPQFYGSPPNQAATQLQPNPYMPTAPQRPLSGQIAPDAMPFVAAPMTPGMSPTPVDPASPQFNSQSVMSGSPAIPPSRPSLHEQPIEFSHSEASNLGLDGRHVIRIPIRLGPGETADIREEDIILQDGDIVFIESRDTEVFFTGGLLGGGQFTLPRDYDLDILQALSLATSRGNGGAAKTVGGVSALNNDVSISPSTVIVLRRLPDGGEVPIKVDLYRARTDLSERIVIQPGDYILLQYTPLEAIAAFVERHLLEGALFTLASRPLTQGN